MTRRPEPTLSTSPAAAPGTVEPNGYEPPAIAWEEAFEPVAATSCALVPTDVTCRAIHPHV